MIIYQRDQYGNLDKNSTLYTESQSIVNSAVNELVHGTETAQNIERNTKSIDYLNKMDLSTSLAVTELYEMMLGLMPPTVGANNFSLKGGGDDMAVGLPVMYANLIINGVKTFEEVPESMKSDVRKVLNSMEMGHLAPEK